jgi:L-threonylcarbamoyladenylate synthase
VTTRTERLTSDDSGVERAAALLRAGELVAIPTETVYGLAVRADDAAAVTRLFVAKGRPSDNPLIVHVADVADVLRVAHEVTPLAALLLTHLAPGPLTVVLDARADLPREVTAGLDSVAVRIPDHPVARRVLRASEVPLAAPSANRSGRPSPTRAAHVLDDLDGRIAAVLDGGATQHGLESTVVDARGSTPIVLREGAISREQLAAVLRQHGREHADGGQGAGPAVGQGVGIGPGARSGTAPAREGCVAGEPDVARSPGLRHRHYAPEVQVIVVDPPAAVAAVRRARATGRRVGIVGDAVMAERAAEHGAVVLARPSGAVELARDLFAALRGAEQADLDVVVVVAVPEVGIGRAVMDRLYRAAEAGRAAPHPEDAP